VIGGAPNPRIASAGPIQLLAIAAASGAFEATEASAAWHGAAAVSEVAQACATPRGAGTGRPHLDSTRTLFIVTTLAEVAAGLALLGLPSVAIWLILGVDPPAPEALWVGRVGGAGLLAIGVACWSARDDRGGPARRGLLRGAVVYNVVVMLVLATAGAVAGSRGVLLWPTVVLHTGLAVWCLVCLSRSAPDGRSVPDSPRTE
jgi:hypothetical protein